MTWVEENGGKWGMEHPRYSVRNAAKPQYIDIPNFLDYTPYQIVCQVSIYPTYWA